MDELCPYGVFVHSLIEARMKLRPCPFCGGAAKFHQEAEDCPSGCHNIICTVCTALVDLSNYADPDNVSETLDELRSRIALRWNLRSPSFANDREGE
jgi:hypothetical protein